MPGTYSSLTSIPPAQPLQITPTFLATTTLYIGLSVAMAEASGRELRHFLWQSFPCKGVRGRQNPAHSHPSFEIIRWLVAPGTIAGRRNHLRYVECMAHLISTTVRLEKEDVQALRRARADGLSASDLLRKGLRVVASRYYSGRRPPSTLLFESTNSKLGDESELFRDLEV